VKSALSPGDVAVVRTGYPGTACVIPQSLPESNCADLVVITPSGKVNPYYLAAIFNSAWGKASVAGNLVGVAQQHFNVGAAKEMEVALPSRATQDRIAGILSAYDDLIENNQRRIKILEEMARSLYREWFVHFRFPSHDKVKMVPSPLGLIPQGWEVKHLKEVCGAVQDGDWIETKDQGGNDYRLLQISNIGVGEIVETGNFRFVSQETFDRLRCTEIKPGDILVARMPTPIGRAWRATEMPWRMITAVDVAIIRTNPHLLNSIFLAQAWNEQSNLQRIAGQASGTTRLRITRRELAALEFVVPPLMLQGRFEEFIGPKAAFVITLRSKNDNLRRTRDLLLPRLLSGAVDLTEMN
jgi:type I restriction enzyme S subunit